eukprot:CAMPEP_0205904436 /NCGR_PEP_ID=MMETSP1325-20131115/725_1 /ASSEMBLY_ACC=CAM_ASM_000708 /TAXON_ID=236786 /ORGANISM="Florenciella sp., Strain RCC1007" /LENGTH=76 /DNA_ID=CAMNT_0053270215 /DNA_START=10 /DNA_END=237 /DNA_ORIENTATION=-
MPSADAMAQASPAIIDRFQAIEKVDLSGMSNLAGDIESLKDCPLQTLNLAGHPQLGSKITGNIKDLPQSITDLNLT